jgi:hypothetical protein
MKKTLVLVAVLGLFASFNVGSVSANVICVSPDHAIYSADNTEIVGCITDSAWKAALASQVNQNDKNDFINIIRGQSVLTTFGFTDTCPTWFPMNCVIKKSVFVKFI